VGLSSEADLDEVIIALEHVEFLDATRLDKLRPGREIVFTEPGRYRELEFLIAGFRDALEVTREDAISYEEALLLWFDAVYSPAIHEIKESGAMKRFPDRTEADLFVWMWQHEQTLMKQYASSRVHSVLQAASSLVRWPWLRIKRSLS
jgi:hypothetical protein